MTDFFALLDQPRQPWLDPEKLKQAFHAKTLRMHPDARPQEITADAADAVFVRINEAYQVLLNPRRRLQHLLALEEHPLAAAEDAIASDLADLFQTVATASQDAERVRRTLAAASTPLSRSLLQPELRAARTRLDEVLATLASLERSATDELQSLNDPTTWTPTERVAAMQDLAVRFAYLTRWIGELEEKRVQLASP